MGMHQILDGKLWFSQDVLEKSEQPAMNWKSRWGSNSTAQSFGGQATEKKMLETLWKQSNFYKSNPMELEIIGKTQRN